MGEQSVPTISTIGSVWILFVDTVLEENFLYSAQKAGSGFDAPVCDGMLMIMNMFSTLSGAHSLLRPGCREAEEYDTGNS